MTGLLLASCQSDSYQINGFALHLQEGDTILLAHDAEPDRPFAMTTVSGGKFYMTGMTDDPQACRVFLKRDPSCAAFFFPDAGNIAVELNVPPTPSRISGTLLNNRWQQLNDSIQHLGTTLIQTAERQDSDTLAHLNRMNAIKLLHRHMSDIIVQTGRRNKDNPLGRFILDNYKAPEFE